MKLILYSDNAETFVEKKELENTRIFPLKGSLKSIHKHDHDTIIGINQKDENVYAYAWDWRVLNIFEQEKKVQCVGFVLSDLKQNRLEGFWYSPKHARPPIGLAPLLYPITKCLELGPGPIFIRSSVFEIIRSRINPKVNSMTPHDISKAVLAIGGEIAATSIPFSKTNLYYSMEDI